MICYAKNFFKASFCNRVVLDQTVEERNKLRGNLAEALTHNALLAAEVDERHAQLEKTYEAQLR